MKNRIWAGLLVVGCAAACGGSNGSGVEADAGKGPSGDSGGATDGSVGGGQDGALGDAGTQPGVDGSTPHEDGGSGGGNGLVPGATNVKIIVEPNGNDNSELVAAINGAAKSVHVTMYLLDAANVVGALIARAKAGIDVKVVLNDFSLQSGSGSNTSVMTQLKSGGVTNVVLSNPQRFNFTHEKTVIIDGTTAWIMTMNCESSSPNSNREYLVVDSQAADATEAEAIFAADFANQPITATGNLVVAPEPPNNARSQIVDLVSSATKTLDIEGEEFSDFGSSGSGVVPAVIAAAGRGIKVRLVIPPGSSSTTQAEAVAKVKAAGVSVVATGPSSGRGSQSNPYIHAKAIVVDCAGGTCPNGYIGSENFTGGSLGYNRELGLIISNGSELGKVEATIDGDFKAGTPQ